MIVYVLLSCYRKDYTCNEGLGTLTEEEEEEEEHSWNFRDRAQHVIKQVRITRYQQLSRYSF